MSSGGSEHEPWPGEGGSEEKEPDPGTSGGSRSVLGSVIEYYSPRREGELPWESGDAYLLGQLGRTLIVVAISFGALYLLSPVAVTGTGGLLRVGESMLGTVLYATLLLGVLVLLVLSGLFVGPARVLFPRTMILQTNVPWREMVLEVGKGLKKLGVQGKRKRLPSHRMLVGYTFPVRADYPPVKVIGSPLGFVTWGGARSVLVVPRLLFRHPKWGQDLNDLARSALAWERPEQVSTPTIESLDEE